MEEIGSFESFEKSLELCRNGLLVGPSSGLALLGLQKYLEREKANGNLDSLRNEDGEIVCKLNNGLKRLGFDDDDDFLQARSFAVTRLSSIYPSTSRSWDHRTSLPSETLSCSVSILTRKLHANLQMFRRCLTLAPGTMSIGKFLQSTHTLCSSILSGNLPKLSE